MSKENSNINILTSKLSDSHHVCMLKEQYEAEQKAFSEAQNTIKVLSEDCRKLEHENRCLAEEISSLRYKNFELENNLCIKRIKCKQLIAALGTIESTVNKANDLYYHDSSI
ncbi:MAG: hypothetical protein Q4F83_03905 [Eubacteriales bacterium]|nr:hypothetical protein [Eubacteriales bacterium]